MNKTNEFSFVLQVSSVPGAGIGVFAVHDISPGTKLALNKEGGESRVLADEMIPQALKHFSIALPNGKRKAPLAFNHLWIVWYLNHSAEPNAALNTQENNYYSTRAISAGEEIFVNYNAFDQPEESKEAFYAGGTDDLGV